MTTKQSAAILTDEGMQIVCKWMALCANPTTLAADHPVLGPTPCCDRCAKRFSLERPYQIEVQS